MSVLSRILISLVLLLAAFLGGFYTGKGQKEVQVVEKTGEVLTVYKDRTITVTRIVHPDGRVEEVTKTEEKEGKTETKTTDTQKSSKPTLSDYSIGAKYWGDMREPLGLNARKKVEITAGFRMFGEVWLDGGIRPMDQSASIGISVKL